MRNKGHITKEAVIKEAMALFNTKGITDTSISDIQKATGLTKGSLYFYFQSKDELAIEALKRAGQEFIEFVESSLKGRTPGRAVENFLKGVLKKHRDTGFVGGCIFGNTALEMSDKHPEVVRVLRDIFNRWKNTLAMTLSEAQKTSEIRTDISSKELSTIIIEMIEGGIMLSRLEKSEKPLSLAIKGIKKLLNLKV
jgi:TetR/AcrR family transcriptional repressor of nem operon